MTHYYTKLPPLRTREKESTIKAHSGEHRGIRWLCRNRKSVSALGYDETSRIPVRSLPSRSASFWRAYSSARPRSFFMPALHEHSLGLPPHAALWRKLPDRTTPGHGTEVPSPAQPPDTLDAFIPWLDMNYQAQQLPRDWQNLHTHDGRGIGFSMRLQMDLLGNNEAEDMGLWWNRTKQDILGFCLEYLKGRGVFAYRYRREQDEAGNRKLVNPYYQKDIVDTTTRAERNGAVADSLADIRTFFLDEKTPVGSLAVMVSPPGKSGLVSERNKALVYDYGYAFLFEKTDADTVEGFTVLTDFTHAECRKLITSLTDRQLDSYAPDEEYVRTLAFITPGEREDIGGSADIVRIMQDVRQTHEYKQNFACFDQKNQKYITWDTIWEDVSRIDALYDFDMDTKKIIDQCESFVLGWDHARHNTPEMIKKALAATIIRLGGIFQKNKQKETRSYQFAFSDDTAGPVALFEHDSSFPRETPMLLGAVMTDMANQPGCYGGGSDRSPLDGPPPVRGIDSIVPREVKELEGNDESWSYEKGTCSRCHSEGVECGPCSKMCKSCEGYVGAMMTFAAQ